MQGWERVAGEQLLLDLEDEPALAETLGMADAVLPSLTTMHLPMSLAGLPLLVELAPTPLSAGREHPCITCNKVFASSWALVRHKRSHTGDRPFPCTFSSCILLPAIADTSILIHGPIASPVPSLYSLTFPNPRYN
jgi:hypothetical protein